MRHGVRQQYLCARVLLRFALERWTGDSADSHRLTTTDQGKPICIDGPAVSVAHCRNIVACAVTSAGQIGIDLEVPRPRPTATRIARSYYSAEEADWLETESADRFYMLWVLKEAYLKATGWGLPGGLDRLRCKVRPPIIEVNSIDDTLSYLGLYTIGEAFLGLATTGFSPDAVEFELWDTKSEKTVIDREFRMVATTDGTTESIAS